MAGIPPLLRPNFRVFVSSSTCLQCPPMSTPPLLSCTLPFISGTDSCCPALPAHAPFSRGRPGSSPVGSTPVRKFLLARRFFLASWPLLTLTIFATSDRSELNTAHTLRHYTGYRPRSSDLYIVQLKVVGNAVQILASGPRPHPIFPPLIKVRETRPHGPMR